MMFGAWGEPDHDKSIRIIHAALDAGINFVDTADVYSQGENEEIVGKALKGRRDDIVLATKFHDPMGDEPNHRGNSRRWIMKAVEDSLRRLQTDYIDLYQVHRPEAETDVEETLSALTDLVRAGKIRYFGSSTFPASQIVEAQWVSRDRGLERFKTEQPPYSILVRGIEADVLPTAQRHGIGVIPWSPLAGGWLSGRYRKGAELPNSTRADRLPHRYDMSLPGNQRKFEAADALGALADEVRHPADRDRDRVGHQPPRGDQRRSSARARWSTWSRSCRRPTRTLDQELLDRIDEIVPPATSFNYADAGYANPALDAERAETLKIAGAGRPSGPPGVAS